MTSRGEHIDFQLAFGTIEVASGDNKMKAYTSSPVSKT